MNSLAPREAYRLWAPTYEAGNPVTHLEQGLVEGLGPSPAASRLLDAGCGTGWRIVGTGAARAVGVDLSPEMLAIGLASPALAHAELVEGDLRALPVSDRSFDLVWCRLAIGYVAQLDAAYAELARVADFGAAVIVTEFHPSASAAGLRRTIRRDGETYELETYLHPADRQIEAAARAGLTLRTWAEAEIGPEVRHFYAEAGREALYDRYRGVPVVLALAFTRDG